MCSEGIYAIIIPEMLLLYALLVLVFVGTLASFQLTREISTESHKIRRNIKGKLEPSATPLSGVVEAVEVVKEPKIVEPVNAPVRDPVPVQVVETEIPRIIHQFWVGSKKRPEKLMDHCLSLIHI